MPPPAQRQEVAEATVRCLRRYVPHRPGDCIPLRWPDSRRSDSSSNAMNAMESHPWELSFSYGRALQEPVLSAWKGKESNVEAAQRVFFKRCR